MACFAFCESGPKHVCILWSGPCACLLRFGGEAFELRMRFGKYNVAFVRFHSAFRTVFRVVRFCCLWFAAAKALATALAAVC
eukprot:820514-Alexandrium_andersonii.AAC.1